MYGLSDWQVNSLVPMSLEQLRLEKRYNHRRDFLQLWYVDASGNEHLFVDSEIRALRLDVRFPWHTKQDWGIKRLNAWRHRQQSQA